MLHVSIHAALAPQELHAVQVNWCKADSCCELLVKTRKIRSFLVALLVLDWVLAWCLPFFGIWSVGSVCIAAAKNLQTHPRSLGWRIERRCSWPSFLAEEVASESFWLFPHFSKRALLWFLPCFTFEASEVLKQLLDPQRLGSRWAAKRCSTRGWRVYLPPSDAEHCISWNRLYRWDV